MRQQGRSQNSQSLGEQEVSWSKHKITIGQLIGKEFNTYYKIDGNGNIELVSASGMWDTEQELVVQNELDQLKNIKELFDHISQKLTQGYLCEDLYPASISSLVSPFFMNCWNI